MHLISCPFVFPTRLQRTSGYFQKATFRSRSTIQVAHERATVEISPKGVHMSLEQWNRRVTEHRPHLGGQS